MRELERSSDTPLSRPLAPAEAAGLAPQVVAPASSLAIVGRGRMGTALARALAQRGISASEPLGRAEPPTGFDAVLLCVPDAEIAAAAAGLEPGPLVGHCSGATKLEVLAPHERFSLHPLMTVTASDGAERFAGAGAAVAGSSPRAVDYAKRLTRALGMVSFEVADEDRAAYHAAASIASNFLITLTAAAERLAGETGVDRQALVALVRATVDNWAQLGAERALTGPVARGDEPTVAAQRNAVSERHPELLPLFDELVVVTRALAAEQQAVVR